MKESNNRNPQPYWRKDSSLHFSIGLVLSLTLVITAFEWNFSSPLTERPIHNIGGERFPEADLILVEQPIPNRPKVPNVMPVSEIEPVPVERTVEETKEIVDEPVVDMASPELNELFGEAFFEKEKTEEAVYDLISAKPKGGMDAFYQYLYKNIRYPEHLKAREATGKVFVKFEVSKEGKIVNVEILKGFDKTLEKEIIRVLENAPAWEPAQLGMEKVQTQLKIPFSFDIR